MSRQITAKRRKYDVELVDQAANVVKSGGLSLGEAARRYQIPKTMLHDRIKKRYSSTHIGVKCVLAPSEEKRIADWALHMSKIGYGRTRQELAGVVKKIIDDDGRANPFLNNKPGRQWLCGFFNRHPELTFRTTVQLGKERAVINKEKLLHWFSDLTACVHDEIKDERILLDPTRLYNADETGFSLCPNKNSKVVGSKGAPVVYHFGNSDKTQMTLMAAASASGHFIPPMIIYPGQRFSYNHLDGFEEAAFGGQRMDGWTVRYLLDG